MGCALPPLDETLNMVSVTAHFNLTFTCFVCGATANGTRQRLEMVTATLEDAARHLTDQPLKPQHMPFQWASFGNGRYQCPTCNGALAKASR